MKLEVGMYVRTKDGKIAKFIKYDEKDKEELVTDYYEYSTIWIKDVIKASHDIIYLIQVGDYVNGYKVSFIGNDYKPFVQCDYPVQEGTTNHYRFYEKAIYSIVTKQQFSQMEYKVGE